MDDRHLAADGGRSRRYGRCARETRRKAAKPEQVVRDAVPKSFEGPRRTGHLWLAGPATF